ncbi:MAG: sensor histidine kinase [Hydrogenophaga sp.]
MNWLDIPTAYALVGLLYLVMPLMAWVVLAAGRSRSTHMWLGGGVLFGIALLMVAARAHVPAWVSYPLANGLIALALQIKILALRQELGLAPVPRWLWLAPMLFVAVFEFIRLGLGWAELRFVLSMAVYASLFAAIARLSWQFGRQENSRSGYALMAVHALGATVLLLRGVAVVAGVSEPDAMVRGLDGVATALVGLFASVLGTIGFLGVYLDRARRNELDNAAKRARHEESTRLMNQIAHLDRRRSMSEMSSSMAHELNQPLAAILTNTQMARHMLQQHAQAPAGLGSLLRDIEKDTQRASRVLKSIRGFVKPGEERRERVCLQRVADEVLDIVRDEARQAGIRLECALGSEAIELVGDSVQLSQVLLNLLRNAMQAMVPHAGGRIRLTLVREDGRAVFRVQDQGHGISLENRPRIGTAFFSTKPDGMGLGLSISRAIVEQHGGRLALLDAPGGGAIAEFVLPVQTGQTGPGGQTAAA